ncbi:hypothetical protein D1007_16580 [Hordeum vulgare]|nr:hypothetical protein D1007_16580 [Hordeum vulgare]
MPNIMVSASHLPPYASPSAPYSVSALETRSKEHTGDAFFATLDPVLKAHLDKMNDDAVARAARKEVNNKAILEAMAMQSTWIDALVSSKPELEARFTQLELSFENLQATSTSVTPTSESLPPATSPLVARKIQEQPSHDASLHSGGPPTLTMESPTASPVTGVANSSAGTF